MDRLPPELLGMIADSIQQDPRPLTAQQNLSSLARTNKTFYLVCSPKIYQHPTCRDSRAATKWSQFYTSRVNPWTLARGIRGFVNDMLPRSIHFGNDSRRVAHLRRLPVPVSETRIIQLAVAPALFSNLTSFSVSTNFVSDHAVELDFLATLFGPVGSNRTTIRDLTLALNRPWPLTPFLLESVNRMDWVFDDDSFRDLLGDILEAHSDETTKAAIRRRVEEEGDAALDEDEYWELDTTAVELASTRWHVFSEMDPETEDPVVVLPVCLKTRDIKCHPFTSLVKLSIAVVETYELYLVFHSRLFPSLIYLEISGSIETSSNLEHDIKLLRHSITKRNGVIYYPEWDSEVDFTFGEMLEDWTVSKEEIEAEFH